MTEGASLKAAIMVVSKSVENTGSHRNSFGLGVTEELVGKKDIKTLSALC